jgi:uncharacterized OB-fold protein
MYQVQQTCKCGQKYWPSQRWIHEKCGVVNHQETTTLATNTVVNASNVVVNRSKDRHKKKPERLEYVKKKMREYRAKKKLGRD